MLYIFLVASIIVISISFYLFLLFQIFHAASQTDVPIYVMLVMIGFPLLGIISADLLIISYLNAIF